MYICQNEEREAGIRMIMVFFWKLQNSPTDVEILQINSSFGI